jgi:hypothetical protein
MGIIAHNTHVTFNGIGSALASGSAGGLLTNIFCGIFQKSVKNHLDFMLVMAFFLRAIRTIEQTLCSYHINNIFISL